MENQKATVKVLWGSPTLSVTVFFVMPNPHLATFQTNFKVGTHEATTRSATHIANKYVRGIGTVCRNLRRTKHVLLGQ